MDGELEREGKQILRLGQGLTRRSFLQQGSLAVGGLALLAACGNASTGSSSSKVIKTLNFGYTSEPETLDPLMAPGITEFTVCVNVMDGLYTTDPTTVKPVPLLAESSKQLDPLTWQFNLRKGIKFTNGESFTGESVQATYARSMSTTLPIKNTFGADINLDHVEVVSDYVVKFHTTQPTPFLLARIANDNYMFPPKYLSTVSESTLARNPIGTGAYVMKEWVAGSHITLEANTGYWGSPKPAIKTVVLQFIADEGTRIDNLKTKAVDIIDSVDPSSIPLVSGNGLVVAKVETGRRVYAGFNTKLPAVSDVRVRQAINYGTNIEQICKSVLLKTTTRMPNFAEKAFDNPQVKGYSYDVSKAKSLLKQAGFGSGLELTWDVDNGSYLAIAQFPSAVTSSLQQIGVDVKINQIDSSTATTEQKARQTHQMYLRSNAAYYDPGLTFSILQLNSAGNATQWNNPEFQNLYTKMLTGGTPQERLQWSYQAQPIVMTQAPMLFLWRSPSIYGVNKTQLPNFVAPADEHLRFSHLR